MADDAELVSVEGVGGEVVVLQTEGECGLAHGAREEGVGVVDVDLGLDEGGGDALDVSLAVQFDCDQLALDVGETVFNEEFLGLLGICLLYTSDAADE